eukprot:CAMPEP_0206502110 /NCGR_PEP_ID=MMETSP0324_2-20121206/53786_1 /ASSEMBLY_ACC=CAM_ASM_000836 /TAXON_ID=2866 /ORGANISM="Crypthecodinium cohnii, Strain Seligo" /LENGTH=441 /DNA_ID=CAMNT_0053990209 /DNA_START=75 /DNA_END=1398 /DNA_ORIENTATION=+
MNVFRQAEERLAAPGGAVSSAAPSKDSSTDDSNYMDNVARSDHVLNRARRRAERAACFRQRGQDFMWKCQLSRCRELLATALELHPANLSASFMMLGCCMQLGLFAEAREQAKLIKRMADEKNATFEDPSVLAAAGLVALKIGDINTAIEDFGELSRSFSTLPKPCLLLSAALELAGDLDSSCAALHLSLMRDAKCRLGNTLNPAQRAYAIHRLAVQNQDCPSPSPPITPDATATTSPTSNNDNDNVAASFEAAAPAAPAAPAAAAAAAAEITESVDVAEAVEVAGQAEVQPKALGTFHSIVRSDATTAAFSSRGGHPFFETSEEKSVGSYSSSGGHVARLEPSVPCELPTALTARRPLARPLKESDTTVRQKKFGPPEGECCEAAGGSVREAALKDLENLLSSLMPANKFKDGSRSAELIVLLNSIPAVPAGGTPWGMCW